MLQVDILNQNFMLTDLFMFTVAFFGLGLQMVAPGYVIGWLSNLLDFRNRCFSTRLLIGLVFSVAITPVLAYWIGKATSLDVVAWCSLGVGAIFTLIIIKDVRNVHWRADRWSMIVFMLLALWIGIALFSLVDIQIGNRVYFSSIAFDYKTRNLLTDAVFRTGIPPVNPHIYPGQSTPVHYYYFWNILPALLTHLTKGWIDARSTFNASTIWAGLSLAAMTMLHLRFHTPEAGQNIRIRSAISLGLLSITGLDIIFAGTSIFRNLGDPAVFENWNGNSAVNSWFTTTLWTPHHVTSLVACLTTFIIVQSMTQQSNKRYLTIAILAGGLSLASAAGMSIYVTFIFGVFLVAWLSACFVIKEQRYKIPWIAAVGSLALLIDLPFLLDLLIQRQDATGISGLLASWVRPIQPLQWLFHRWELAPLTASLTNLLLLPMNYFLELGVFLLAGVIYFRHARKNRDSLLLLFPEGLLLITAMGICSFFYSSTASTNELGWRGLLPAQFVLLIWVTNLSPAILLRQTSGLFPESTLRLSTLMRTFLRILIVLGLLSSVFSLVYQRVFFIYADWLKMSHLRDGISSTWQYGERLYSLRQVANYINHETPPDAVVQSNPGYEEMFMGISVYLLRQTVVNAPYPASIYGNSEVDYRPLEEQILPIFQDASLPITEVNDICRKWGIDYLLVKDIDPLWKNPQSWLWLQEPVFSNSYFRLFSCNE